MMRYIVLILFTCCMVVTNAQTRFSLQQSIEYTLKNHPSISVYDNNLAIAKERSAQSRSGYLPQISGSANYTDNIKLQTSVLPAGILGPTPTEISFGTKYATIASLDVKQTLYDQSKITGIKASKPFMEITRLEKEQNNQTLIYNTAKAYFQVLIYREQLAILKANRSKYEEMVKVLQYQYSKGTVLEKDVDRVKVNLNITSYQIEDATTKEQLAINTLKNAMGMSLQQQLTIADSINYESFAEWYNNDSLSVGSLIETKINERSIELQKVNVKVQQGAFLPTLSAVGKYATQSLNNNFSDAFSSWNKYSFIGISLNVPLFNGFKQRSLVKEEKLNLKNGIANLDINKQNLQLRFENAKTSVGSSYSSYKSNKDNMALAKKLLDVTDYQYQRGVVGLTDYLNDDAAYKVAQSNYINSLYNIMVSQLDYQKSKGSLNEFINQIK